MENFDNFIGSIGVSVLKSGLGEGTEVGLIVRYLLLCGSVTLLTELGCR